jgi:hypothetical protein
MRNEDCGGGLAYVVSNHNQYVVNHHIPGIVINYLVYDYGR